MNLSLTISPPPAGLRGVCVVFDEMIISCGWIYFFHYCWNCAKIIAKDIGVMGLQIDYGYLCQGLGHLSGLEVRLYQGGVRRAYYTPFPFEPDVAELIREEISDRKESAYYVETPDLLIFGVIRVPKDEALLILGPTSQIQPNREAMTAILRTMGEPHGRLPELQAYFGHMISYPFENFLEILCFVNYAVNEEKLTVADLIGQNSDIPREITGDATPEEWEQDSPHNTYQAEQLMLSYVTTGNVTAVQAFFDKPPEGRVGAMAHSELRQRRNTFICAATLMSRAAIAGGMQTEMAFALSDRYIQKAELLEKSGDIARLNMDMLLDYTKRVEALKCGTEHSRLARSVMRYVQRNIGEKILIPNIAATLGMNRSYLCERYQAETGDTIGSLITNTKIDEAKRLLLITGLTTAQISEYLGYSSQSYFQTVFRKVVGCTPKVYRDRWLLCIS